MGLIIILFLTEIRDRQIRQQSGKTALCLDHQGIPVRQEKEIPDPTLFQQDLAQRDDRPRFPAARRHDQQRFPPVLFSEAVTHGFDGRFLIVPPGDGLIDSYIFQTASHTLQVEQLFQVTPGIDPGDSPFRILMIQNPGLKSVGQENDRTPSLFFRDEIRVQRRLLPPSGDIHTGALGFHDCQHPSVTAQQGVIRKAHLCPVRHPRDLVFIDPVFPFGPSGILQHGINIQFTGLVFRQFQWFRNIGRLLFLPSGGQFLPQRLVLFHQRLQIQFFLFQRFLLLSQLLLCFPGCGPGLADFLLSFQDPVPVEVLFFIMIRIAAGDKIQKNEKVFQTEQRFVESCFSTAVGGTVSETADVIHTFPDIAADDLAEILRAHKALQIILPGLLQFRIHGIHPFHREFHRPPAVHDAGFRIQQDDLFRGNGHIREGRKPGFCFKTFEIVHGSLLQYLHFLH